MSTELSGRLVRQGQRRYGAARNSADEILINRPRGFVIDENLRRLDQIKAIDDPEDLFASWLGRPDVTT